MFMVTWYIRLRQATRRPPGVRLMMVAKHCRKKGWRNNRRQNVK